MAVDYDIVIVGSGPAGIAAAEAARQAGAKRIAVIESSQRLGGECPNWGCIPTKSLLSSVEEVIHARRGGSFGLPVPKAGVDFGSLMRRKSGIVDLLTGGGRIERHLEDIGAEIVRGRAVFTGPDEIDVGGRRVRAESFVLATGSEPTVPPIDGIERIGYLTVPGILALTEPPKSLAVLGGGPIGAEFAQIFAPLGSSVTVIEFAPHILSREDDEIAAVVEASFRGQGIGLMTSSKVVSARHREDGTKILEVEPVSGGSAREIIVEEVLLAAGKRPAFSGLGLDRAGVEIDAKGRPVLNDFLQTANPKIYAAGDAAGRMMFTSVAHREGQAAAWNALRGNSVKVDLSVMPRGIFTHPEVGSVGLTEREAKAAGYDVSIGRAPYAALSKSLASSDREGLVKLVCDRKTGLILGGHIVGHAASELIHEVALAMYAGLSHKDLANMIHAFPTFAEGVALAAADVK
jgi:dihydrolipoamide dehydrogenase